ncbi:MAG: hypothetical protein KKH91_01915 [Elusimicrobia bacterium]|nr:hypothetical protein [Elusimicrobiota bacterium]MBU2614748.1 hypothetical protein [Elusimicrobiota bacterium]
MKRLSNKKSILFFALLSIALAYGCGKKAAVVQETEPPKPRQIVIPTKQAEEIYRYSGEIYRDPFAPLTEKRMISASLQASGEAEKPNIGILDLKGISIDRNARMAILSGPMGSYILKNGKLFDSRNRLIRGITGSIEGKSVTLSTDDKFTKTFKLSGNE